MYTAEAVSLDQKQTLRCSSSCTVCISTPIFCQSWFWVHSALHMVKQRIRCNKIWLVHSAGPISLIAVWRSNLNVLRLPLRRKCRLEMTPFSSKPMEFKLLVLKYMFNIPPVYHSLLCKVFACGSCPYRLRFVGPRVVCKPSRTWLKSGNCNASILCWWIWSLSHSTSCHFQKRESKWSNSMRHQTW